MVILNATFGLILKFPSTFSSLFDLVNLIKMTIKRNINDSLISIFIYYLIKICSFDQMCHTIERFANTLYLVSLASLFVFYFNFDKKFNSSFKFVFSRQKKEANKKK